MMSNFIRVIGHLHLKAVLLFFFLGADPAVGGHPQFPFSLSQVTQQRVRRDFCNCFLCHGDSPFKPQYRSADEAVQMRLAAESPVSQSSQRVHDPGSCHCCVPEREFSG